MKPIEFTGAPGSPYTRKMLSLLRYRHLPYKIYWGEQAVPDTYPKPKVGLLPTFFFRDADETELKPVTDSTPIIRRLEKDHAGRSVLPEDPLLNFLNSLIEDYADEWLTKAMFHFRWAHEADWKNAAPLLVYWHMNTATHEMAEHFAAQFAKRQIDRLHIVGSSHVTAQTIEKSYERLITLLDTLIAKRGFVLGARPSAADFALHGQLTQLAIIEPTSADITRRLSQRVRAWIDLVDDLSGLEPEEPDWFTEEEAVTALRPMLEEIGKTYAPAMLANANAVANGEDSFETEIDGRPWSQKSFKYQAKCLHWLQTDYAALSAPVREQIQALLSGAGCEDLFREV